MRKQPLFKRLAALAAPLAVAAALSAPVAVSANDYNMEHFWSAQPEGTAWVTGYGECWQSLHGAGDLEPCVAAAAPPAPKEFTVRLNFEFDKYRMENVVNDGELARLDDYIAQVKNSEVQERISLTGHTDAKGSDAYNYQLGLRRAQAVQDYMISRGISPQDIVSVESRGKSDMLPGVDIYSVEQRRVRINADY
ncbi:OmpA family protein [Allochromatium vinosum]|uniref:OmpA/MotB domain protein n=1 Tax=Allochromatium vinosum (strain ATCC 17899 / DSM 180 / NBRC 103801 / NCIMB 10441 / D) TaxID=572477 RepID=D3RQI3_ALLVD|nr:OmpA family protein [Allochromatium vinosum]ADC61788.1 OmpA/MotB domain protein [Allochromatium vinosum DSM 180]MBK1653903.1 OmpA family protein [Allochromatium vinosum]